jgi:acyl dehydratase
MTSGYFEDTEAGDSPKAGPYFVSKGEIIQFAKQYDARPFHIDEEAAARSVFAGLTASGAHTFAIFISLKRDEIGMNRHRALGYCLSMIFSENRFALFRIML